MKNVCNRRALLTLTLLFVLASYCDTYSQYGSGAITLFDKDWLRTKDYKAAVYYRTVEQTDNKYLVKDYYISNDNPEMIAVCEEYEPEAVYDGKVVWYHENGNLRREAHFKDGIVLGLDKRYYEDGSQQSLEVHVAEDKKLFAQYWSRDQIPMLVNGTGIIQRVNDINDNAEYAEILDSTMVAAYSVTQMNNDTIYTVCEQRAEYKNGFKKLYKGVGKQIRYPADARRHGIEGRVFVEFVVDKDGSVQDVKVVRGIGGGCDEEALRAFNLQKDWKPGVHKGKPVKVRMVLPITFRLG